MGLSETLSYTFGSGSPGVASLSMKESLTYHMGTTGAPKLKVLLSEALGYVLKYIPPAQASVKLSLSEALGYKLVSSSALGALLSEALGYVLKYIPPAQASVKLSLSEALGYKLVSSSALGALLIMSESLTYSASVSVTAPKPKVYCVTTETGADMLHVHTVRRYAGGCVHRINHNNHQRRLVRLKLILVCLFLNE